VFVFSCSRARRSTFSYCWTQGFPLSRLFPQCGKFLDLSVGPPVVLCPSWLLFAPQIFLSFLHVLVGLTFLMFFLSAVPGISDFILCFLPLFSHTYPFAYSLLGRAMVFFFLSKCIPSCFFLPPTSSPPWLRRQWAALFTMVIISLVLNYNGTPVSMVPVCGKNPPPSFCCERCSNLSPLCPFWTLFACKYSRVCFFSSLMWLQLRPGVVLHFRRTPPPLYYLLVGTFFWKPFVFSLLVLILLQGLCSLTLFLLDPEFLGHSEA